MTNFPSSFNKLGFPGDELNLKISKLGFLISRLNERYQGLTSRIYEYLEAVENHRTQAKKRKVVKK